LRSAFYQAANKSTDDLAADWVIVDGWTPGAIADKDRFWPKATTGRLTHTCASLGRA